MPILKSTNLAIRFGLEVTLLTSIALWSWRTVGTPGRVAATVLAPLAVITIWVSLVHGDGMPKVLRTGAELMCFAAAIAAVWQLDHHAPAIALGGVAMSNAALLAAWDQ